MTGFIAALKVIRKIDIDGLKKHEKDQMVNQLIREIKNRFGSSDDVGCFDLNKHVGFGSPTIPE